MSLYAYNSVLPNLPEEVLEISSNMVFEAGQYIVCSSEPTNFFYILMRGNAKLIHDDADARPLIIDIYHPGDFFGEMEMLGIVTKDRSIITMSQCEVLRFSHDQFFELWNENNEFSLWVLQVHTTRLLHAGDEKINADRMMLRVRVFRIIQDNLNEKGYFLYTKQILSEIVGVSIRSLNRTLKELEIDRLITISSGTIKLCADT